MKTFFPVPFGRLKVALSASIDGLISADLATSAVGSTETLNVHLYRLQESQYAVEMLVELTETLEGRQVDDLTPSMLLRKIHTIANALSADEETAYLSKCVGYLMKLVQLIIDANGRDVAVFVRTPQVCVHL